MRSDFLFKIYFEILSPVGTFFSGTASWTRRGGKIAGTGVHCPTFAEKRRKPPWYVGKRNRKDKKIGKDNCKPGLWSAILSDNGTDGRFVDGFPFLFLSSANRASVNLLHAAVVRT